MRYVLLLYVCLASSCVTPNAKISGEVYITTMGRQTIQLSGAEVYILEGITTKGYLDRSASEERWRRLANLPQSVRKVSTDSAGRFQVTLPKGSYYILVMEQRALFEDVETYQWLVPVDSSNGDVSVTLNHTNLFP